MLLYEFDEEKHNQTIKNEAYEDGFAEGEKFGYEAGEKSEKLQTVRNMKSKGYSLDDIADITGLSVEEVEHI